MTKTTQRKRTSHHALPFGKRTVPNINGRLAEWPLVRLRERPHKETFSEEKGKKATDLTP